MWEMLGDLPPRDGTISCTIQEEIQKDDFILEKLLLNLNGMEKVPAYFIRPYNEDGPFPAILYNHVHGGDYQLGGVELIEGWRGLQDPPWGMEFVRKGWAALSIDMWNFGERHRRSESSLFKEMLWKGRILWGMMVYDAVRSLDYLCTRQDVNENRIGTLGMSLGSTMSWWLAALDERITVCVDICCLTDFESLIQAEGLDLHGLYYYVPGLLKHFNTSEINALIAPRPHLSLAGLRDALTPVQGLEKIDRDLRSVYEQAGKPDGWKLIMEDVAHEETPSMRKSTLEWLDKWL